MSGSFADRRVVAGLTALGVVAAALAISPRVTLAYARGLADDPVAFGLFLFALYFVRPALAWPGTLLSVVVGWGYGFPAGVPVALAGVTVTTLPPFFAARWFGQGEAFARTSEVGRRYFAATGDARGVAAARLAPIPADAVTCAAGLGDVRLRSMIGGTLVGELPWTIAAVLVGSSTDRLSTGGLGAVGLPLAATTVVAAAVLLAGPAYALFTDGEKDWVSWSSNG